MKRTFLLFLGILCLQCSLAQSVSKEIATKVAMQYIKNSISNEAPQNYAVLSNKNGIDTSYTQTLSITGYAPLYLVQLPDGWILVASEYIEVPVLASARTGQFPNLADMPDGMKWLISYYEEAMQYVQDSLPARQNVKYLWDTIYENSISSDRDTNLPESYEIPNLRNIHWNQSWNNDYSCSKPYNAECPTWYTPSCGYTYVGCTAVAMGILMRYYQWPYSAQIPNAIDSTGNISGTKHLVTYNWEKMPYEIYNSTEEESVNEIAGFLRDCGYASKMKYGSDGSSASFDNARNALLNNFHYQSVIRQRRRWFVGNWINKLKSEIAENRPVMYAGYNNNGGHAFVLFGYTASNKFNINWGWGGAYNNGEFSLDSIKPYPTHSGYFNDQEVLWNIIPKYPDCGSYIVRQSDVNQTNFEIYKGGMITLQNITINNNQSGTIFSGNNVRLISGVQIASGTQVRIGVRDMHCDREEEIDNMIEEQDEAIFYSPKHIPKIRSSSPSTIKIINKENQILILRGDKTYTITGQKVD